MKHIEASLPAVSPVQMCFLCKLPNLSNNLGWGGENLCIYMYYNFNYDYNEDASFLITEVLLQHIVFLGLLTLPQRQEKSLCFTDPRNSRNSALSLYNMAWLWSSWISSIIPQFLVQSERVGVTESGTWTHCGALQCGDWAIGDVLFGWYLSPLGKNCLPIDEDIRHVSNNFA